MCCEWLPLLERRVFYLGAFCYTHSRPYPSSLGPSSVSAGEVERKAFYKNPSREGAGLAGMRQLQSLLGLGLPSCPVSSFLPALKTLSEQPDKQHRPHHSMEALLSLSSAGISTMQGLARRRPGTSPPPLPRAPVVCVVLNPSTLPAAVVTLWRAEAGPRGPNVAYAKSYSPHVCFGEEKQLYPEIRLPCITPHPLSWKPVWLCSCCQTVPLSPLM